MATATIYIPAIESAYATEAADNLTNTTPSLGPEWIRHVVRLENPGHDIRIVYDGIGKRHDPGYLVKPDDVFFGVSCTSLSYRPALPYMDYARDIGVPVLVGGAHARAAGPAILRSRPGVYVVPGHGELVVKSLLDGKPPACIPGLCRRQHDDGQAGPAAPYEVVPFLHTSIDYQRLFDIYADKCAKVYRDESSKRLISVRGINGCTKPVACSFCAVQRVGPFDPVKRGKYLATERKAIAEQFGPDVYIRDCSDSLPAQDCLQIMAQSLEGGPGNRVYCGAMVWDLLKPERLSTARRAGYTDFLLGLEGFSKTVIAQTGKPKESFDMICRLLSRTRHDPLHFFISGIVGWAGEDPKTMAETKETIQRLLEFPNVVAISVNYLLALPGTKVHHDLVSSGIVDMNADYFDMRDAFVRHLEIHSPQMTFGKLSAFLEKEIFPLDERVIQVTGLAPDQAYGRHAHAEKAAHANAGSSA